MTNGEGPRPGGQSNTWRRSVCNDIRVFRATQRSTEHSPLVFGVETEMWPIAAKKASKSYREVLEAAERFIVRWPKDGEKLSRIRHASIVGGAQANGDGGGNSRKKTAVDQNKNETQDSVYLLSHGDYAGQSVETNKRRAVSSNLTLLHDSCGYYCCSWMLL